MSLIINHNISAMNTQRNLERSNGMLSKSLEKLSSGYKINVAADDPSGLIISEQLRSQTHGLQRAIRNSQEASNVIGIAEGALIEMNEILRTMRGLAIHAANNGVTSTDQIRADQAEIDSGIQTLDRIATTTKYSDQFLLNGSKGIIYRRTTVVDDTMDMELLDITATRLDQVFKREDVTLTINFNGELTANQPDHTKEAHRAYFEADDNNANADISGTVLSADQKFSVTGTKGSRTFAFGNQTTLGAVVEAIDNIKDSTGVGAALTFASSVDPDAAVGNWTATRATGDVEVYGANMNDAATDRVASITMLGSSNTDFRAGFNTDGHGYIYAEVSGGGANSSVTYYKDAAKTVVLGTGDNASFTPATGSGLNANQVLLATTAQAVDGEVYKLAMAGLEMDGGTDLDVADMNLTNVDAAAGGSIFTGVELGNNTDQNGYLYFQATGAANNRTINVYKDADMAAQDLVATGTADLSGAGSIRLEEQVMDDGTSSGLNITLSFTGATAAADEIGSVQFAEQGVRLYSTDYGSTEFIRVRNQEGTLWQYYRTPDDNAAQTLQEGLTQQVFGADASISVNGSPLSTTGLTANITTQDYSGALVFNEGDLGETRIAVAGYDVGAIFSRAGSLQAVDDTTAGATNLTDTFTYATNARHVTTENLTDFIGGMQYQLGETDGDQSRTVYGIPSMSVADMGRIVTEDGVTYTLSDVLAGGEASLNSDPVLAMRIVAQAIDDVSSLRARLGAFQKNMLQTNINSLNVAVENITHTESAIRDANMAAESSDFTKNQILVQAGTAMLAQANVVSQNVLQLLG